MAFAATAWLSCAAPPVRAAAVSGNLVTDPATPWRFFSDRVMGGVSEGAAEVSNGAIRLTGTVSTANRGGFIQVRTDLDTALPDDAAGLEVEARGNGERYFVHLRTRGLVLPWQYYQAGFEAGAAWARVRLPLTAFKASGALMRAPPRPGDITSVALVAYGRDHVAELEARYVAFYAEDAARR
jgi:hypothetical protein